jgi:hypothetical protein
MPEKQMHPHPEADVTNEENMKGKPQPGTRAGQPRGDAREDDHQLRKNQDELGVGPDHKTDEMKEHHRGTFP